MIILYYSPLFGYVIDFDRIDGYKAIGQAIGAEHIAAKNRRIFHISAIYYKTLGIINPCKQVGIDLAANVFFRL